MYPVSKPKLLVVAQPFPFLGGGGLRAMRSLETYPERFDVNLLYNSSNPSFVDLEALRLLARRGVNIVGSFYMPGTLHKLDQALNVSFFRELGPKLIPSTLQTRLSVRLLKTPQLVMSLHECFEELYIVRRLSDFFEAKSASLLQLPPFYGLRDRREKILEAYTFWYRALFENSLKRYMGLIKRRVIEQLNTSKVRNILREFDLILAVSRAIPFEMGYEWESKIRVLDPGVALDLEDLLLAEKIRRATRGKGNHIIFGGRPSAEKGLIEGLLAFKSIVKVYADLKLIVTGLMSEVLRARMKKYCKKIGLEDKVSFKGYIPRIERFKLLASARLMLYPSHVDSFSYTVLESLFLGTPVVGYRIPALEIYYGEQSGVILEEEGDIEALTAEALNLLDAKLIVETPKIRSWKDIMKEEMNVLEDILIEDKSLKYKGQEVKKFNSSNQTKFLFAY